MVTCVAAQVTSFKIGHLLTIAGTGVGGYNGDGILATTAQLSYPYGVAVNSLGEVLIVDTGKIRKILVNGMISTIAQVSSPRGVAVNSGGEVVITEYDDSKILKILSNGDIITVAQPAFPFGVAVNSLGEVLTTSNQRLYKILVSGTITTIAGTGVGGYNNDGILATTAQLNSPTGVAVNSLGEVLIADRDNNRIRKILQNGYITTIAGTGTGGYNNDGILATNAQLNSPYGVAVNSLGEVLIADHGNNRIRKIVDCPPNSIKSGEQCNCLAGYYGYGQDCNKFNCSNILFDRSDVCSSNGKCVSPNNCTCNTGYSGTTCEVFGCYGISSTDSNVCSGLGKCNGHNQCSCNTGYSGNTCDTYYCSSKLFNDTTVCTGVGKCSTPNNCTCNTGYYGSTCDNFNCFGRSSKGTNLVCTGIGDCIAPDQCSCPPPPPNTYYNPDCSQQEKNSTTDEKPNNGTTGTNGNNGTNVDAKAATTDQTTILIAAIVPSVAVILIVLAVLIMIIIVVAVCSRRKKSGQYADQMVPIQNIASYEMRSFAHSTPVSDFPSQYSNSSKLSQVNDPMDRYTDMVKIGQGGFGSVYKVKDTKAGNETKAIKVIRFENNGDLNNAMKEGIQLLKMNHPNVLKVNDFFIGNGQVLCIDMVYYEIGDLNKLIYGTTFCSERVISQILLQSCSALDYIYKHFGVVHRDIKPSNIFIQKMDNSNIHVVIADFGLAKNTNQSTSFSFAGTPMFVSPEMMCGLDGVNQKTDVFSLGVTIYQLLSHDTTTSINQMFILKGSEKTMEILREKIDPQYSTELVNLTMSMLEKDPEDRPDTTSILENDYFKQ